MPGEGRAKAAECYLEVLILQYDTLLYKYDDHAKLMEKKKHDSSFTHSVCQLGLETEAKSLKQTRSRMVDCNFLSLTLFVR